MNATAAPSRLQLLPATQERIVGLFRRLTRLELGPDRGALLLARLAPVLRRASISSFEDFIDRAERGDERLRIWMVGALTTHVTSFFRESHHFELLARHARGELAPRRRKGHAARVWSAACSTGEEAYSAACVLSDTMGEGTASLEVLGTDIDAMSLEIARRGEYSVEVLTHAIPSRFRPHFQVGRGSKKGMIRASPPLQRAVSFQRMNLLDEAPPGEFDAVFCRNVLIYFRRAQVEATVNRLARKVRVGGLLFLGHSEGRRSLPGFEAVGPTAYRRLEGRGDRR